MSNQFVIEKVNRRTRSIHTAECRTIHKSNHANERQCTRLRNAETEYGFTYRWGDEVPPAIITFGATIRRWQSPFLASFEQEDPSFAIIDCLLAIIILNHFVRILSVCDVNYCTKSETAGDKANHSSNRSMISSLAFLDSRSILFPLSASRIVLVAAWRSRSPVGSNVVMPEAGPKATSY
jgi:hypothetical protein